jgi:hypothetical protein
MASLGWIRQRVARFKAGRMIAVFTGTVGSPKITWIMPYGYVILSEINPVHFFPLHLLHNHFNIILQSAPRYYELSVPRRLPLWDPAYTPPVPDISHTSCRSLTSLFDQTFITVNIVTYSVYMTVFTHEGTQFKTNLNELEIYFNFRNYKLKYISDVIYLVLNCLRTCLKIFV